MKFAALALALTVGSAFAEDVTIRVGYSAGGGYDAIARLIAEHLGKHIAGNPNVIVSNEGGAGSLKLAKLYLASGKSDGTEIAMVSSALALNPVFSPDDVSFDPTKVHYIASLSNESSYCVVPMESPLNSFDDLLTTEGIKIGSTGKDSTTYIYPAAIKAALGAKYEIVVGFEGGAEVDLAMERGDIQARCGISFSGIVIDDSKWKVLAEIGPVKTDAVPGVAFVLDRITDPATKEAFKLAVGSASVHYPFILHPDASPEVIDAMRKAFADTIADPEFIASANTRNTPYQFTGGAEVEARIAEFLEADPATKELARQLVQ